jgi:hypothetical protein
LEIIWFCSGRSDLENLALVDNHPHQFADKPGNVAFNGLASGSSEGTIERLA